MERPSHDPTQRRPHGLGDAWVDGPDGRFWGTFGAAGLLLAHPEAGVLLQHRAIWSHHGGTWGVPPELVRVLGNSVFDVGYWSYTTVLAVATEFFEPYLGDAESIALSWVPIADVAGLPLHPGLASGWPALRARLAELDPRLS
jgi:8-oxo-dGTP diphosphatase